MTLSWIVLVSKSLCNRANIITKYKLVFLREKSFELIIFWRRFHPFSLEPKNLDTSLCVLIWRLFLLCLLKKITTGWLAFWFPRKIWERRTAFGANHLPIFVRSIINIT